ncbi:hypothetical protein LTR05_007359 [Lithohypha guttulata]|uniref:Phytanoyl-CoA dioxygenase n=1 Tax=Lithohypha guttulata TaxID=1690604 RepID=A0AAN7SUY7_9EURO|nr:hypothetical protein LTR05_007359 [Lithohypha guttulata]
MSPPTLDTDGGNTGTNGHTNGYTNGHTERSQESNGTVFNAPGRIFDSNISPRVEDLKSICDRVTSSKSYPLAASIQKNIPIYDMNTFTEKSEDYKFVEQLKEEWYQVLFAGPGVIVLKGLYSPDRYQKELDSANAVFQQLLRSETKKADQEGTEQVGGRVWNSFRKLAVADPDTFVEYFSNPWLSHVSDMWLGPAYRLTSQVNIVPPSGKAQPGHRDYHMGYFEADRCVRYPRVIQTASQFFSLQGAVAHGDMPADSGPTRFLPYSQMFEAGYMAHRRQEFQDYFVANYVSLPLQKGDGVFFNPAIFHGAGENVTKDFYRHGHLLQVNSCFVKPMEALGSVAIVRACWDILKQRYKEDNGFSHRVEYLVQAVAEGHPFPGNMDKIIGGGHEFGMQTEQDILRRSLKEDWTKEQTLDALTENRANRTDD